MLMRASLMKPDDISLAKDAVKGLYILASQLCLFPLYEGLLEVYEDLEYEMYADIREHYRDMMGRYNRIRGIFHA